MKSVYIIYPVWVLGILCMADASSVMIPGVALYVGAGLLGIGLSWPQFQSAMKVDVRRK